MLSRSYLALLLPLAACGGESTPNNPDAMTQIDASMASVRTVTCPPGAVPTITVNTAGPVFDPLSVTISTGGIVKFVMFADHDVAPNPIRPTDPGLKISKGATGCLEFDKSGTFSFICTTHSFAGMVVVQ